MKKIKVGYTPVGIKINPEPGRNWPAAEDYSDISYCAAVRTASDGTGRALRLSADSISTCMWSPVVLGMQEPQADCDLKVEFTLPLGTREILLAPLSAYSGDARPDIVLVRTTAEELKNVIKALGWENFNESLAGQLDRSALEVFQEGGSIKRELDRARVQTVNTVLGALNGIPEWRDLTKEIFKNKTATYIFDMLLDRFLSNMSMCRNSTAIPMLTGKANISYFCTGGIAWGRNKATHMTCGIPYDLCNELEFVW